MPGSPSMSLIEMSNASSIANSNGSKSTYRGLGSIDIQATAEVFYWWQDSVINRISE